MTLNPSIDYIVHVNDLKMGDVNRMSQDFKLPGGKGINVSRILQRIDSTSTALGFLGGFTGEFIEKWMKEEGIDCRFTPVKDDTRINVKLKSVEETEINGQGPTLSEEEVQGLKDSLANLSKGDIVVLSGSTPGGLTFHSLEDIITHGQKLLAEGAKNVLISMAGDGALLITEAGIYQSNVLKRELKNSVGAGDSMIAGFIGQYAKSQDPVEAFKWGVACGSATASSDDLAEADFIKELLPEVEITKL